MIEIAVIIPVIIALGELWKKVFGDKVTKFIPIINLALGIVTSIFYSGEEIKIAIFQGIIIGLSASGLYSSAKNVFQGIGKS